jgi:galactitol-specific phosphotransferase system IIC component
LEVVGIVFKVSPEQMVETGVKVGVILGFTEIVKFVVDAHCPAVGVNV